MIFSCTELKSVFNVEKVELFYVIVFCGYNLSERKKHITKFEALLCCDKHVLRNTYEIELI